MAVKDNLHGGAASYKTCTLEISKVGQSFSKVYWAYLDDNGDPEWGWTSNSGTSLELSGVCCNSYVIIYTSSSVSSGSTTNAKYCSNNGNTFIYWITAEAGEEGHAYIGV